MPPHLAPLWQAFCELDGARSAGPTGPAALSFQDIRAWEELFGVTLAPWEVLALKAVDHAALAIMYPPADASKKP